MPDFLRESTHDACAKEESWQIHLIPLAEDNERPCELEILLEITDWKQFDVIADDARFPFITAVWTFEADDGNVGGCFAAFALITDRQDAKPITSVVGALDKMNIRHDRLLGVGGLVKHVGDARSGGWG